MSANDKGAFEFTHYIKPAARVLALGNIAVLFVAGMLHSQSGFKNLFTLDGSDQTHFRPSQMHTYHVADVITQKLWKKDDDVHDKHIFRVKGESMEVTAWPVDYSTLTDDTKPTIVKALNDIGCYGDADIWVNPDNSAVAPTTTQLGDWMAHEVGNKYSSCVCVNVLYANMKDDQVQTGTNLETLKSYANTAANWASGTQLKQTEIRDIAHFCSTHAARPDTLWWSGLFSIERWSYFAHWQLAFALWVAAFYRWTVWEAKTTENERGTKKIVDDNGNSYSLNVWSGVHLLTTLVSVFVFVAALLIFFTSNTQRTQTGTDADPYLVNEVPYFEYWLKTLTFAISLVQCVLMVYLSYHEMYENPNEQSAMDIFLAKIVIDLNTISGVAVLATTTLASMQVMDERVLLTMYFSVLSIGFIAHMNNITRLVQECLDIATYHQKMAIDSMFNPVYKPVEMTEAQKGHFVSAYKSMGFGRVFSLVLIVLGLLYLMSWKLIYPTTWYADSLHAIVTSVHNMNFYLLVWFIFVYVGYDALYEAFERKPKKSSSPVVVFNFFAIGSFFIILLVDLFNSSYPAFF